MADIRVPVVTTVFILLLRVGMVRSSTCSKQNSGNCDEIINASKNVKWKPFTLKATGDWEPFISLFEKYAKWHNATMQNSAIPCGEKEVLVFRPNAGLGDSAAAATAALSYAFTRGRLFFIDWRPHDWSIGLKELPFNYDLTKALTMRAEEKPLICVENDATSFIEGHVTINHPITTTDIVNDIDISYTNLMTALFQPSNQVEKVINRVWSKPVRGVRTVALVIRTGEGEYNQFLSEGDEIYFVRCFENFVRLVKPMKNQKYRVFVASDQEYVKSKVVSELQKFADVSGNKSITVDIVTLDDSIVHLMHIEPGKEEQKQVREKIVKTFAEYFIIGSSEVLFLTHGSLFGRSASERGVADEQNVHFISDSACDGERKKYSYLECHKPKYPKICGFS